MIGAMLNAVPFYKRFLSYIYPVRMDKGSSEQNPVLELFLNCGQWQLATEDAIYSDGDHYRPLVSAFNLLQDQLSHFKQVLVLGAGLGSAVQILNSRGVHPSMTLVDNDPVILDWLKLSLKPSEAFRLELVCSDADAFISSTDKKYQLVIVDIFTGRLVPDFVEEVLFLENCRRHLEHGGSMVLNYIINNLPKWENFHTNFSKVYPDTSIIELGVNRLLIAKI
jgi:hypothetical protein